jgi:hypothetical protein
MRLTSLFLIVAAHKHKNGTRSVMVSQRGITLREASGT